MHVRQFTNEPTELRTMSSWLRSTCLTLCTRPDVIEDAELCANEWFANLVAHAFPDGGRHRVTMTLTAATNGVRLVVEDDGIPFDMTKAPAPGPPRVISEARPGGYGLVLIRGLARELHYERLEDRNRLTLLFTSA